MLEEKLYGAEAADPDQEGAPYRHLQGHFRRERVI